MADRQGCACESTAYDAGPASYQRFGVNWIRRVLDRERVLRTIDDVLGEKIELGPIGAGPGRAFASVSILGQFHPTSGEEVPAELLTYAVNLPISVVFDLALPLDTLTFSAEVLVPLVVVVHTEEPVCLRLEIRVPTEDQIELHLHTDTRRGRTLQRIAGLESELRRFLIKVLTTELDKPYVKRATFLDMEQLIDHAWPALSSQFLPQGPDDRKG
ncbi:MULTISPECIES: hypothetical protein [Nocardioides]|uniref:DUF2589 domain-containing protein n=1 Tax=Nocardioides vastitatis TaxID=2568655 RepID=A0ABW0ZJ09_9ACTN|nr:hypothetical protein [Nocardioides sp.]THJ04158.1 hypothetical protein E7Z54_09075 [Nocardioides sp.]